MRKLTGPWLVMITATLIFAPWAGYAAPRAATLTPVPPGQPGTPDDPLLNPCTGQPFTTVMTNAGLAGAFASADSFGGAYVVSFTLADNAEAHHLAEFTAAHIGQPLAIVLDGEVVSVPIIREALRHSGQIAGNFSREEAEALAAQLRYSALPTALTLESVVRSPLGLHLVFAAEPGAASGALRETAGIVRGRLEATNTSLALVRVMGAHLSIDLPGRHDSQFLIRVIQRPGLLELVDFSHEGTCRAEMPRAGQYILTDARLQYRGPPPATPTPVGP